MPEASVPDGATQTPESINDSPNTEPQSTQPAQPVQPSQPDMHGFTSEELGKIRTFFDNSGGFEAVKSKISNPQLQPAQTQPQQPQQPQQSQSEQSQSQPQPQPQQSVQLPKGYASLQELSVERYFKDLASDPKYANISEDISNGNILKEMSAMGMTPIDENYNINVQQVNQFLALKSASVPTKPTSSEPTNIPTVEYVHQGQKISDRNSAFEILHQSFDLKRRGLAPHPQETEAQEFLKNH